MQAFLLRIFSCSLIGISFPQRSSAFWRSSLMVASSWVLLAAPLLLLYSGERGTHWWKYFFYAFYPAHFLVLVWIGDLLQKVL